MHSITKTIRFEAAHKLPEHDGKCRRLHGHSYVMQITVAGRLVEEGSKAGMVMDFGDLKQAIKPLVEEVLDHHYLNETVPEKYHPTTAENLCRFVADWLGERICERIESIAINETCTGRAMYKVET